MGPILVVPGLNGSGPDHWQSWMEQLLGADRVEQADWTQPDIDLWAAQVSEAIEKQSAPVWLIAHSFGCLASVVAASRLPERVAGALFVAPACPEKFGITARIPIAPLTFPAVLAASRNDPWMKYLSAVVWADRSGARLIDLGAAGHVNVDSGHGAWPEGLALFRDLQRSATALTGASRI